MSMLPLPLTVLFDLNFIGYMVLVTVLYLPALQRFQNLTRWLLIGYTAITIILWYIISGSHPDMVDYIDKAVEVVLIAFLLAEIWLTRRQRVA
jgi:TM2 domain-containing membrane protein YozV